jgi:hypothetical protein
VFEEAFVIVVFAQGQILLSLVDRARTGPFRPRCGFWPPRADVVSARSDPLAPSRDAWQALDCVAADAASADAVANSDECCPE